MTQNGLLCNIIRELILAKVKLTNEAYSYVEAYEGIRRERYSIIMYEGVVAQRRKNPSLQQGVLIMPSVTIGLFNTMKPSTA